MSDGTMTLSRSSLRVTISGFSTGTEPKLPVSMVPSSSELAFTRCIPVGCPRPRSRPDHPVAYKSQHPGRNRNRIYLSDQDVQHMYHSPICSFQSLGIGSRLSLQQYVHGILSISSTPAPCELVNTSRPSIFFLNELITGPRPCHILPCQTARG